MIINDIEREEEQLLSKQRDTIRLQEQQIGDKQGEEKGTNPEGIELEEIDPKSDDSDGYDTEYDMEVD